MLLRTDTSSIRPVDGHLAALAGERMFCSEVRYRRGTEVFGEGEETEYVCEIISGAVRTYKLLSDGRRQINSFHLPGDMFGLENGATHRFTAEAVVETRVRITKRRSLLETMQAGNPALPAFLASSRAICSMQRITCFCLAGRRRWSGWPRFCSKSMSGSANPKS